MAGRRRGRDLGGGLSPPGDEASAICHSLRARLDTTVSQRTEKGLTSDGSEPCKLGPTETIEDDAVVGALLFGCLSRTKIARQPGSKRAFFLCSDELKRGYGWGYSLRNVTTRIGRHGVRA